MILKRKIRYVLVEASSDINVDAIQNRIYGELSSFLGELNYSEANPRIMVQYNKRMFSIRVNRGIERKIVLSLSFAKIDNDQKVGFYTIKTSGTLKTLLEYAKKAKI